jgi:quercetin dioxygenase-like cupin family protein
MSALDQQPPSVIQVPPGGGHSFWVYGDQDTIKLGARDTGGSLMVMETVVHPHEGPPLHIHRLEDEAFYVLDGEMKVVDNDRESIVGTGALVFMPKNSVHRFENVRDTPSTILVMFIPGGFEGYLMEMGTPVVEGQPRPTGPVDFDKVARVGPQYGLELAHVPQAR